MKGLGLVSALGLFGTIFCNVSFAQDYQFSTFAGLGVSGFADGVGRDAKFSNPRGIVVDKFGNILVADRGNACIRKITADGKVSILAGNPSKRGCVDGPATNALFTSPMALALDKAGNVYVADCSDHVIRKITTEGIVLTLAGNARRSGYADGTNKMAHFNVPRGVAADELGRLYVADNQNNAIRMISPDGVVTTLAGKPGEPGSADGSVDVARFNEPAAICVGSNGTIFVTETGSSTVRAVTPQGTVTTIAGKAGEEGDADGRGSEARFRMPDGIAMGLEGTLYVVERVNSSIRKITPDGTVTTLGGRFLTRSEREFPFGRIARDGRGKEARFYRPSGIAIDRQGVLYITDSDEHTIRVGRPVK